MMIKLKLSQPTESQIPNIEDIQKRHARSGECFILCAYAVTKYWANKLSGETVEIDYDVIKEHCSHLLHDYSGIPPGRIDEVVRTIEKTALLNNNISFHVTQPKQLTIRDLEDYVLKMEPIIPIYDLYFYQYQENTTVMHCSVVIGFDAKSILVNDDQHGREYPLQRSRFMPAWEACDRRAISIRPKEPTYRLDRLWRNESVTSENR